MTGYHGAVDLSGKAAALAVADANGNLLLDANRPMRGRESAQLASWIIDELAKINLTVSDIGHWTVGSGPGSFTGMRLAASLVVGWSSRLPVKTRNVPTALAIAAQTESQPGDRIAVLFDGRNSELLAFEVIHAADGAFRVGKYSAVWSKDKAEEELAGNRFERFVTLRDDIAALEKLLGVDAAKPVAVVESLSVALLLRADQPDFDNDLTQLVYIRPAVFTTPEQGK